MLIFNTIHVTYTSKNLVGWITKKMKWNYQGMKHFQDWWVVRLLWTKSIINVTSNVHHVQCTICSKIESKDKIFVCKLDNLCKHASKCKVKVASRGVEIVSFYFNLKIQHAHYWQLPFYFGSCCKSSPWQETQVCPIFCCFLSIVQGQMMINFEGLKNHFSWCLRSSTRPRSIGVIRWVGKSLSWWMMLKLLIFYSWMQMKWQH